MDDTAYSRISQTFNTMAWGDSEPDADEYNEARENLNELISRDFPELSDSDLFKLRDEIIEGIEKVKRILGLPQQIG